MEKYDDQISRQANTLIFLGRALLGCAEELKNLLPVQSESRSIPVEKLKNLSPARSEPRWIPVSEGTPEVNEEAYSNDVLVSLRKTVWDIDKCKMVHITKIAYYNENAISSDGRYMDTEGWVLEDGNILSMNEVIAWRLLPESYQDGE